MGTTAEELRGQLAVERSNLGSDLEAIGDRVSPSRIAQRKRAAARQRFSGMRDRVMGTADDLRDAVASPVGGAGSSAVESMRDAPAQLRRSAQGNPLAAGLVAFGVGLVVATLLPETEPEHQLAERVQPQLENMAASAGEAAQELVESVKPAAQQAAQEIKQDAHEAVEHLKEQASDAADITADQARSTT